MPDPSLSDLLQLAADAAYTAGRRTLAYFGLPIPVDTKSDNTPVTIADRQAEQTIRDIIAARFPDHSILGEEHGEVRASPDYRWIIDPIDGTKSFIHGVPLYGTLVGLEIRSRPSVGAVYLPATDELIVAADGLGCWHNGRRCRASNIAKLEDATLCVTSHASLTQRSDAYEKLAARVKLNRGWGDCYGYMLVATGRAEIMLDHSIKPWDCAPLLPILRESGGVFSTWTGEQTIYGPDALAANAALHEQVLAITRAEVRRPTPIEP